MSYSSRAGTVWIPLLLLSFAAGPLSAQGIGGRLRNAVRDRVVAAVACRVTDAACIEKAKAEGKEVKYTDAAGNEVPAPAPGSEAPAAEPARQRPGQGAWANYDFIPGERGL